MSTAQSFELECPKCGKPSGFYEVDSRTVEDWFACQSCGWAYRTTVRRFGQELIAKLNDVVSAASSVRWTSELDQVLESIADQCRKNGWREENNTGLAILADILLRDFSDRGFFDWNFIIDLSQVGAFFAVKDGWPAYDYIEQPPELVKAHFRDHARGRTPGLKHSRAGKKTNEMNTADPK